MAPQFGFQQDFFDAVKNFLYSVRKTFSMPAHDAGFYNDVLLGAGLGGALGATTSGIPGAVGGAIVGGIQGANLNTYNNGVPVIDTSYLQKNLLPYKDNILGANAGLYGGAALGGLLGGVPGATAGGLAGAMLGGIGGATPNSGYPNRPFYKTAPYKTAPNEPSFMNRVPQMAQKNKQVEANRSQAQDERRFMNVVPSQGFPPRDERRFDEKPQQPSSPKTQAEANRSRAQVERRYMDKNPASKAIVKPPLNSYIKRYKRD